MRIYKGNLLMSCIFLCVSTSLHHLTEFQTSYTVTSFRTLWKWSACVSHSSHVDIPFCYLVSLQNSLHCGNR